MIRMLLMWMLMLCSFPCLPGDTNPQTYGYPAGSLMPYTDRESFPTAGIHQGSNIPLFTSGNPIPALSDNRGGLARFIIPPAGISQNDVIVLKNCKDCSHVHFFWGNKQVVTNHRSDPLKLRENCSSTAPGGSINCSGYWAPAMVDIKLHQVQPYGDLKAYYKVAPKTLDWVFSQGRRVVPPPPGLSFVSGVASNKSPYTTNQALNGATPRMVYGCTDASGNNLDVQKPYIPFCPQGGKVHVFIKTPQCWDGVHLSSPDHFSHMAMTLQDDSCPMTHPIVVAVPSSYGFEADVTSPEGTKWWEVSSDDYPHTPNQMGWSGHIDYTADWLAEAIASIAENCINQRRDSSNSLCDGRRLKTPN